MLTKRYLIIVSACLIFVIPIIGMLSGCNKKSAGLPIFSAVDSGILRSAYSKYEDLRKNNSPQQAREQLLADLTRQQGVSTASLGIDGYTIFISYSDGDYAAVDTFNPADYVEETQNNNITSGLLENYTYYSSDDRKITTGNLNVQKVKYLYSNREISPSALGPSATYLRNTAKSRKLLILAPVIDDSIISSPSEIASYFKAYGWTDADIRIKKNTKSGLSDALQVNLQDFIQIGDYGIILYFGHAAAGISWTEDKMYIQGCTMTKEAWERNDQYRTWKNEEKLVIKKDYTIDGTNVYDVYLRADLLRQIIGPLPASFVELAACNGAYFSNIFLDNGAKVFTGWDNKVWGPTADKNLRNMIKPMLLRNLSAYDTYQDTSIIKEVFMYSQVEEFDEETDEKIVVKSEILRPELFKIFPSPEVASAYYLPTWINLTLTGVPEGTLSLQAGMINIPNNQIAFEGEINIPDQSEVEIKDFGSTLYYKPFPPGESRIYLRINGMKKDGKGNLIMTSVDAGSFTFTLNAGQNNLRIDLGGITSPDFEVPTSTPTITPDTTMKLTTTPTVTTTPTPNTPTTAPISPVNPTTTIPLTSTNLPLTSMKIWVTTTNDPDLPVDTVKLGSVNFLYVWAKGGENQEGDFTLKGTTQHNTEIQFGEPFHAMPDKIVNCGQWKGVFLNTEGAVKIEGYSAGKIIGNVQIVITSSLTTTPDSSLLLNLSTPVITGLKVTINGGVNPGSSDKSITKIKWDWGDGIIEEHWFPASHSYSTSGEYTVKVSAYQSDGITKTQNVTVSLH